MYFITLGNTTVHPIYTIDFSQCFVLHNFCPNNSSSLIVARQLSIFFIRSLSSAFLRLFVAIKRMTEIIFFIFFRKNLCYMIKMI